MYGGYWGSIPYAGILVFGTGPVPGDVCGGDEALFFVCADDSAPSVLGADMITHRVGGSDRGGLVTGTDSGHSVGGGDRSTG